MTASVMGMSKRKGWVRSNWASSKVQVAFQAPEVVEFMQPSCLSKDACNCFTAFIIPSLSVFLKIRLFIWPLLNPVKSFQALVDRRTSPHDGTRPERTSQSGRVGNSFLELHQSCGCRRSDHDPLGGRAHLLLFQIKHDRPGCVEVDKEELGLTNEQSHGRIASNIRLGFFATHVAGDIERMPRTVLVFKFVDNAEVLAVDRDRL